jgi:XTP/dITP diphosphohydrolase
MAGKIIVATTNKHKLREIKCILGGRVKGIGVSVRENGKTFEANAVKKVRALKLKEGEIGLADDSGLMVACLGGKPGVRSARFATPPTAENLCRKLLHVMRNAQCVTRRACRQAGKAKFVCVIAVAWPSGEIRTVKGVVNGRIIKELRGSRGFGYDPVFVPAGYKKTFAEMSPVLKNKISHRGRALKKLKAIISAAFRSSRRRPV